MKRGAHLLRALVSPQVPQETLASQLECTQQAVSAWANGTSKPSLERMLKLQSLYGIPVEAWAEETEEAAPSQEPAAE